MANKYLIEAKATRFDGSFASPFFNKKLLRIDFKVEIPRNWGLQSNNPRSGSDNWGPDNAINYISQLDYQITGDNIPGDTIIQVIDKTALVLLEDDYDKEPNSSDKNLHKTVVELYFKDGSLLGSERKSMETANAGHHFDE